MNDMLDASDIPAPPVRPADRHAVIAERAWKALESVMDPELPQLSILDLGMIRFVETPDDGSIRIGVSPTYSGCPAQRVIHGRIREALQACGIGRIEVRDVLTPAWTSEWITERGRAILRECGIAPPLRGIAPRAGEAGFGGAPQRRAGAIRCPHCDSARTDRISEFGSTPCKAQYRCLDCLEPFEYFKCI